MEDQNKNNLVILFLQAVLTSIVLKRNVTMLDIVSTRMLGQFGFLAKVRYVVSGSGTLLSHCCQFFVF